MLPKASHPSRTADPWQPTRDFLSIMQKSSGNYQTVILVLSVLAAIATAGYLVMLTQGFDETLVLPGFVTKNNMNPPDTKGVVDAIETISKRYVWTPPVINKKSVPLNKSVLLVRKGGEVFDLDVEKLVFRPPMTNVFLVGDKNGETPEEPLPDIFSPNIGDLDADEDGFSNLEEFNAKTNPRDATKMPPHTNKLFLKQRISNDYVLKLLNGEDSGAFQIRRLSPEPAKSVFVTLNSEFGFDKGVGRFVALSFEKKKINHPTLGEIDSYIVKMRDNATKSEFVLEQGVEKNLAEYEAQFEFRWKQVDIIAGVKKGKTFQLPRVGTTYQVLEIEDNKAVICPVDNNGKALLDKRLEILQN
jgi:hypothetical protein